MSSIIDIKALFNYHKLMEEKIIKLNGKNPGPISIVLVGVHGDERNGVEALNELLPNLKIEFGKVFFAYGNPLAIEKNTRHTGRDLNRMFKKDEFLSIDDKKSYEYSRAQFLKKYLDQSDVLLDIHASPIPNSNPFIICEPNSFGITKFLPLDTIVTGFDEVEPGGTDYYMNSIGKIGICTECGCFNDPKSIQVSKNTIISFLKIRGHIKEDYREQKQTHINMYYLHYSKTNDFKLIKNFEDFENLDENQTIGFDGDERIKTYKKSIILFARDSDEKNEEVFLLGEYKNDLAY